MEAIREASAEAHARARSLRRTARVVRARARL